MYVLEYPVYYLWVLINLLYDICVIIWKGIHISINNFA